MTWVASGLRATVVYIHVCEEWMGRFTVLEGTLGTVKECHRVAKSETAWPPLAGSKKVHTSDPPLTHPGSMLLGRMERPTITQVDQH